jgi:hypothetical protein
VALDCPIHSGGTPAAASDATGHLAGFFQAGLDWLQARGRPKCVLQHLEPPIPTRSATPRHDKSPGHGLAAPVALPIWNAGRN